ncbi:CE1759 family FMN reductase [Devosia sp. A449]
MPPLSQDNAAPVRLVAINGGVSDPSSTRMLVDQMAQKTIDRLAATHRVTTLSIIDLAPLAVDIAKAMVAGFPSEKLQAAIDSLASADAVIAATPVYKAGISGLFKSFIDLIDSDLLIAKPVLLGATAGTARHAMVTDDQMRPLFAFLRAIPMPTSVFVTPDDWGSSELAKRIDRGAVELSQFVLSGVGLAISEAAWQSYQHQFAGNATRAEHSAGDVDFDTDLMRLATGGSISTKL